MIANRVLFISVSLCLCISCSSTKKVTEQVRLNTWQVFPIIADGDAKDWSFIDHNMQARIPVQCSFANDKERLYVLLKTSDQATILKMMTGGMQLWIDVSGKKQKSSGIVFPMGSIGPSAVLHDHEHLNRPDAREYDRLLELVSSAREYALQGFPGCAGAYLLKQSNKCGIVVRIATNNHQLVWEASIPFSSFLRDSLTKNDLGKKLRVGFEINRVPGDIGRPGRIGESGNGVGGRGAGMEPTPARPIAGGNDLEKRKLLFEATTIWQTIYLAYNG